MSNTTSDTAPATALDAANKQQQQVSDTPLEQMGPEGHRRTEAPSGEELANAEFLFFGNRICPFAHRGWWAALEVGAPLANDPSKYVHIDLGPNKPAWYKENVNQYGTVPFLIHEGKPIYESNIVAEFLDEVYDGGLMPKNDAHGRAAIRLLMGQFGEKVVGKLYQLLMNRDAEKAAEKREAANTALEWAEEAYGSHDAAGPYFLGERFSLADIVVLPFLDRFSATLQHYRDFDIFEGRPRLQAAYEAAKTRPAFAQSSQDPQFYIRGYSRYANGN